MKIIKKLKTKFSNRILFYALIVALAIGGIFLFQSPAHATISAGSVTEVTTADVVAGAVDADYSVSFSTDDASTASNIIVTFPANYTITGSALGTTAVDDGTTASSILVNSVSTTVSAVTGDATNKTITITLTTATDLNAGVVSFRILTGIQNPTVTGTTGTFTINSDATSEAAQTGITGVTITADTATYLAISGATSMVAGASQNLTITAYDQYNNIVAAGDNAYTGAKTLLLLQLLVIALILTQQLGLPHQSYLPTELLLVALVLAEC